MTLRESLIEEIRSERQQREQFLRQQMAGLELVLIEQIRAGDGQGALENLIFFTSPAQFSACLPALLRQVESNFGSGAPAFQAGCLRFLAELSLAMDSFLPRWNLQNGDMYGETALDHAQVVSAADQAGALAAELAACAPTVAEGLLAEWRTEATARLKAEQAPDPEAEASALVGGSVPSYLADLRAELSRSHLRRISELRAVGETLTEISNDYAAFLPYVLYLGASFVTCNPPLVDMAWAADPERWNPVVDALIADHPDADEHALARLVTMEVVLDNMRPLRPIFLLTEGRMGCVCLQVNPHNQADAEAMYQDGLFLYEQMKSRLDGRVPNVVFKLPGTQAGLEACQVLNAYGIGTTITVNFGMFQHLPFARIIQAGQSIFSCLVEMNGRLAYPVRDELLGKLEALHACGIDEAEARQAAAWAGVAVVKRLVRLLREQGYDLRRVKPLIASLRNYSGADYQDLPGAFPDISEILGASIVSVFPNIRRPFDGQPAVELDPRRVDQPVPDEVLNVLRHSQLFRQAYYVADREWLAEEDERFRPEEGLRLEDEAATAGWVPVQNTLNEFCSSYDTFVERIRARRRLAQV
jgi:hypothetical protein